MHIKNFCARFIQKDASCPPEEFFKDFDYKLKRDSDKKDKEEEDSKEEKMMFDMASCQFSMHYMFKSEEKVKNFL